MCLRIVVAVNEPMTRYGFEVFLRESAGLEVVSSEDTDSAGALLQRSRAELALLQLDSSTRNGLHRLEEFRNHFPGIAVASFLRHPILSLIREARALGVCVVVCSECTKEEVMTATAALRRGSTWTCTCCIPLSGERGLEWRGGWAIRSPGPS